MRTRLLFEEASSLLAPRDLFTEVGGPAGVALQDPSFVERGMTGLLVHGAAAADVDGDGRVDLFTTGLTRNWLYLNAGDGTFREAALASGVSALLSPGVAPLFLDADDDGDQDLFVTTNARQVLLENRLVPDGRLMFRDVSSRAGVDVQAFAFSAAAGDVNRDGRADIYVACYNDYGRVVPDRWDAASNGTPNLLLLNEGGLRFREAAAEMGVADTRWSYAAAIADADGDLDLDILSVNDFGGPSRLYVNDGGRFADRATERGLDGMGYAMGVSFGDHDADGDLDLHLTRMSSTPGSRILGRFLPGSLPAAERLAQLASGNGLLENVGGGKFRDVSAQAGPFPAGWAWGGGFLDLDNDGLEDLYTPNGFVTGSGQADTASLFWRQVVASGLSAQPVKEFFGRQVAAFGQGASFSGRERDFLALNRGDGTFLDVSGASGIDSAGDGRGAVFADLDDDGDLDVYLRAMHGPGSLLFRNEVGQDRGSFRVALEGRASGRDAYGAVVRAGTSAGTVTRVKVGGSGFVSQSDPRLLLGLDGDAAARWLEVTWPSGLVQRFPGPRAGERLLIVEGEDRPRPIREKPFRLPDPPPRRRAAAAEPGPPPMPKEPTHAGR